MTQKKKVNFSVFEIMFGIMWLAMGLEGVGKGDGGATIGRFYGYVQKWFGSAGETIAVILGVLIMLSAVVYLVRLFVPSVPSSVVKPCMVFLVIVWLCALFCSLVWDASHLKDFTSFLALVENLFVNLLILSATMTFCGGSIKG